MKGLNPGVISQVVETSVTVNNNSPIQDYLFVELKCSFVRCQIVKWHRRTSHLGRFTLWHNGCRATQQVSLLCDKTAAELHNSVNLLCGITAAELNPI